MPPSTTPSIFNAISSPDPRCENSEAMLPRNGKALSQPHNAWLVLALGAYLLRCRDKAGAAVHKPTFLKTIAEYNAAVQRDIAYNPTVKDGRTTKGLAIDKTNWAMPLEKPPYEAYCTTCGVTFTFSGLRIDTDGRVLDTAQKPIPGLYAAGELVGGLFYFN